MNGEAGTTRRCDTQSEKPESDLVIVIKKVDWMNWARVGWADGRCCVTRFEKGLFAALVTQQGIARGKEDKRNRPG